MNIVLRYRRGIWLCLVWGWLSLLGTAAAHADSIVPADDSDMSDCESGEVFTGDAEAGTYSDSSFFDILDTPQKYVAVHLEDFVRGTDEFFANEKTSYASTGSYARVTLDTVWSEGGQVGYAGKLSLKVRLPATEGKLKLLVESDPPETRDVLDRRVAPTPKQAADQNKYYAGFLANFGREVGWQFEPSLGLHIGSPLQVFTRFRAVKHVAYQDWLITINNTLYWYNTTGSGDDATLEFNYQLANHLLARATSFSRWTHQTQYFSLSQVFSLIHTLSERRAVTYSAGMYGTSEPTVYATDYLLSAQYRQALHRKNLFMELVPEVRFRQINQFKNEYSLLLRLEWLFQE